MIFDDSNDIPTARLVHASHITLSKAESGTKSHKTTLLPHLCLHSTAIEILDSYTLM